MALSIRTLYFICLDSLACKIALKMTSLLPRLLLFHLKTSLVSLAHNSTLVVNTYLCIALKLSKATFVEYCLKNNIGYCIY